MGTAGGLGLWTCHSNSGSIEGALPVELSVFNAISTESGVLIQWRTESEQNNLGFNIYRSTQKDGEYVKVNAVRINGAGSNGTRREYQFVDENVQMGQTYYYYLEDVDFFGNTDKSKIIQIKVGQQQPQLLPQNIEKPIFALLQNYPNPFNPETWIPYKLAQDANVLIHIYNANGCLIRTLHIGNQRAGAYLRKNAAAYWDGRDSFGQQVTSGVYFYSLRAGDFTATRRMVIVR